jgi:hypothetical protein
MTTGSDTTAPLPVHERWLQVATAHGWWLVDVEGSRLCRTELPHDPRFVADTSWTPFAAFRLDGERIEVDLADGQRLSALRAA